ncbi:MAG: TlyA family RNA methyltransferase [Verrucomicrobium sp.]|nr:TlyA family RNA methyltransferase [Verrucomicrobium sp.]
MKKIRLDQALVERGLCESREKAQRAILAGQVWIGGHRAAKASQPVLPETPVELRAGERYVSRGGEKLAGALAHFAIAPTGWRCLDVGASTGGFTDCLLQHGAAAVTALDVGRGQLHWKLRQDPRVDAREGVNARVLDPAVFGSGYDLAVLDLSFISLRLVLPAAFALLREGGLACALIKPQFEAGRKQVGKGGIVRDEAVRQQVIDGLRRWREEILPRAEDLGVAPSVLKGTDGNQEYLWVLRQSGVSSPPSA